VCAAIAKLPNVRAQNGLGKLVGGCPVVSMARPISARDHGHPNLAVFYQAESETSGSIEEPPDSRRLHFPLEGPEVFPVHQHAGMEADIQVPVQFDSYAVDKRFV